MLRLLSSFATRRICCALVAGAALVLSPAVAQEHGDHGHEQAGKAQAKVKKQKPTSRPKSRPAGSNWGKDSRGAFQRFGASLDAKAPPYVPANKLVANLDKWAGKTVRVEGVVQKTCPKKGCWMWVTHGKRRVFVRFKDYAFFVPKKNAQGRKVVFEGKVNRRKMSVAEARHYAEDAGDFEGAKKITKPVTVPFVMATAVRMYGKAKPKAQGDHGKGHDAGKKHDHGKEHDHGKDHDHGKKHDGHGKHEHGKGDSDRGHGK